MTPETISKSERMISKKVAIKEINEGVFVQDQENEPNYLLSPKKDKIYRCNIIATILTQERKGPILNLIVDDGSGIILIRFFETSKIVEELKIGNTIIVIGKVRVYNNEKYISPEIVKKIDLAWLKARNLEKVEAFINKTSDPQIETDQPEEDLIAEELIEDQNDLPFQKIIKMIKELDKGEGVFVDDIIEKSPINDTEKIIERMMEKGEIFQIATGKIKVL